MRWELGEGEVLASAVLMSGGISVGAAGDVKSEVCGAVLVEHVDVAAAVLRCERGRCHCEHKTDPGVGSCARRKQVPIELAARVTP